MSDRSRVLQKETRNNEKRQSFLVGRIPKLMISSLSVFPVPSAWLHHSVSPYHPFRQRPAQVDNP